nr:MAG TPA: portal protein [Crassvirales sp.]
MNSKLEVLRGEETARVFDYRVVITNPNSISEIENNKRDQIYQELQKAV